MLKLEFLMKERNISDEQLAVLAECTARTIENYRKGNTKPDVLVADKIATALQESDAASLFRDMEPVAQAA